MLQLKIPATPGTDIPACGLEWLVLPFDRSPETWRAGALWGALLIQDLPPQPGTQRFFDTKSTNTASPADKLLDPEVALITIEPQGRRAIMRLLLAQLGTPKR